MYKKTGTSTHYLPRKGSYSTHPKRNGRVDVLPPEASEALYDCARQIADAHARIDQLRQEREKLTDRGHGLRRVDDLRSRFSSTEKAPLPIRADIDARIKTIDEELAALRKHAGSLKALLAGGGVATFEDAFHRIASAELSHGVYETLAKKARMVLLTAHPEKRK